MVTPLSPTHVGMRSDEHDNSSLEPPRAAGDVRAIEEAARRAASAAVRGREERRGSFATSDVPANGGAGQAAAGGPLVADEDYMNRNWFGAPEARSEAGGGAAAAAAEEDGPDPNAANALALVRILEGNAQAPPSADVTLVNDYRQAFMVHQMAFARTGDNDLIEPARQAYRQLRAVIAQLSRDGSPDAEALGSELERFRTQLLMMNKYAPGLTGVDLDTVSEFFEPPVNRVYKSSSGLLYVQPATDQFFNACKALQLPGGYVGSYVARQQEKDDRVFDIYCLTKQTDQIEYEDPTRGITPKKPLINFGRRLITGMISAEHKARSEAATKEAQLAQERKMQERIRLQNQMLVALKKVLDTSREAWGYKAFQICDRDDLKALGWSETDAATYNAIFGYYEKAPS